MDSSYYDLLKNTLEEAIKIAEPKKKKKHFDYKSLKETLHNALTIVDCFGSKKLSETIRRALDIAELNKEGMKKLDYKSFKMTLEEAINIAKLPFDYESLKKTLEEAITSECNEDNIELDEDFFEILDCEITSRKDRERMMRKTTAKKYGRKKTDLKIWRKRKSVPLN